jgi:hypothetical protein
VPVSGKAISGVRISSSSPNTIAAYRDAFKLLLAFATQRTGNPPARCRRDAIERRLAIYTTRAATNCPTLHDKSISAHVLRDTAAMRLLHTPASIAP